MLTSKEKQMTIRRRKGFGPDQVIDLDKYENRWTEEEIQSHVKRGKFITKIMQMKEYVSPIKRKDGNMGHSLLS
jgi:2-oxoglutarate dehydrogenase complex dehydrogenase (E1) component-like enzyme